MDIEKELNKLIIKYDIDRHIPKFRKYLQALSVAKKKYHELKETYGKIVLVSDEESELKWFQRCICENEAEEMIIGDAHENIKIPEEYKNQSVVFWVVMYHASMELLPERLTEKSHFLFLYDLFLREKIYFEAPFYKIYNGGEYDDITGERTDAISKFDMHRVFWEHKKSWQQEKDIILRKIKLEQIIFDCVYVKDFVLLKEFLQNYINTYDKESIDTYKKFQSELELLLYQIKEEMKKCNQQNCFMFWLDALEYGEDIKIPFLKNIETHSITFDNIYTITPYTGPTFKTLFAKKKAIEDESFKINKINKDNSSFIGELEKRGYQFCYFGVLDYLENTYCCKNYYNRFSIFSSMCWDMLRELLLEQNTKKFWVLHELSETHAPFVSLDYDGEQYVGQDLIKYERRKESVKYMLQQREDAKKHLDKQLEFWHDMLPQTAYQIYMSDHGASSLGKYHTFFKIFKEDLKAQRIDDLVSYYDFDKIIFSILDKGKIDGKMIGKEYIPIQDVDFYNKEGILWGIEQKGFCQDNYFGYQGIVTKQDMLIHYKHGLELYQKHKNDEVMVEDARIRYLRTLISDKVIDMDKEEKFCYSRIYRDAWLTCKERTREEEKKKINIIREIFEKIPEGKRVAIRGGGMCTLRLLMLLEEKLRKKIFLIIDKDKDCIAGKMGIKVSDVNHMKEYDIDYVIIVTYDYHEEWKKEMQEAGMDVIDLYDILNKNGIPCSMEFYKLNYIKEDFGGWI